MTFPNNSIKNWTRFIIQKRKFDKKDDCEKINQKQKRLKKYTKSDLIYDINFSFYKYHNVKRFDSRSFESKYSNLFEFKYNLDNFNKLEPAKKSQKRKK